MPINVDLDESVIMTDSKQNQPKTVVSMPKTETDSLEHKESPAHVFGQRASGEIVKSIRDDPGGTDA